MKTSECRSCGDPIIWMKTKTGKNMPVDAETVGPEDGDQFEARLGHISHFATCEFADKHRRK